MGAQRVSGRTLCKKRVSGRPIAAHTRNYNCRLLWHCLCVSVTPGGGKNQCDDADRNSKHSQSVWTQPTKDAQWLWNPHALSLNDKLMKDESEMWRILKKPFQLFCIKAPRRSVFLMWRCPHKNPLIECSDRLLWSLLPIQFFRITFSKRIFQIRWQWIGKISISFVHFVVITYCV